VHASDRPITLESSKGRENLGISGSSCAFSLEDLPPYECQSSRVQPLSTIQRWKTLWSWLGRAAFPRTERDLSLGQSQHAQLWRNTGSYHLEQLEAIAHLTTAIKSPLMMHKAFSGEPHSYLLG
jgi:hypothetical protein